MAAITQATLLGTHPSVQDLNIATSPTVNNPNKQYQMQNMRNLNANFIGDDFTPTKKGGQALCAPTGGPRIVATRNEDAIRKGAFRNNSRPSSLVGAKTTGSKKLASLSSRPLAQEERDVNVPPLFGVENASTNKKTAAITASGELPPKSPASNSKPTPKALLSQSERMKQMSLPQLVRLAERRRKPDARTPSEISLVTSVESRDASTNHPCSETVYSCECCRPKKPGSFGTAQHMKSHQQYHHHNNSHHNNKSSSSSVIASSAEFQDDDADSMYDNLTSVSQRGESKRPLDGYALPPKVATMQSRKDIQVFKAPKHETQITARQIFEMQQAKAAASGSYGHNLVGSASGRKAMGFGLQSQKVMDHVTNRGLSARTAASDVSTLTHTSIVAGGKKGSGSKIGGVVNFDESNNGDHNSRVSGATGSRLSVSSSKVSSSAVRKLEAALEQERLDRLKAEEQISSIRQRQERLMKQLSAEERRKMEELIGDADDE